MHETVGRRHGVLNGGGLSSESRRAGAGLASVLNHIEAVLIAASEPTLNKQGGRFGKDSRKILQLRDDRLGPTQENMITELWEELYSE